MQDRNKINGNLDLNVLSPTNITKKYLTSLTYAF